MSKEAHCPQCGTQLVAHPDGDECPHCPRRPADAVAAAEGRERFQPGPVLMPAALQFDRPLGFPGLLAPSAFRTFRRGVNLLRWGAAMLLVAGAVYTASREASLHLPLGNMTQLITGTGWLMTAVRAVGAISYFVGLCCCCAVPRGSRPRGWGRALLLCILLAGLVVIGGMAVVGHSAPGGPPRGDGPFLIYILAVRVSGLAVAGCLFMVLAAVARWFGDASLAKGFAVSGLLWVMLMATVGAVNLAVQLNPGAAAAAPSAGDLWGAGASAFQVLARQYNPVLMMVLDWSLYLMQAAMSVWVLFLLTRLYRLIPGPAGSPPRQADSRPTAQGEPSGGQDASPSEFK